jgi:excinuclease UvrABC nuclease subunit
MSGGGDRAVGWQRKFDGRLEVQPPLGDEQLLQIPARRGVMALLGPSGEVVLLATAADIRGRLRRRLREPDPDERKKTADLREVTRAVLWRLASGHFETDLRFLELAEAIYPRRVASMLAWKAPFFVHVDPAEEFPHFVRTRKAARGGRCFGPFPSGRQAERFIEAIQDAMDLCRDIRCLRQSPHGQRCPYGQMGRCPSPCDGSIDMSEYRRMIERGVALAEGRREDLREAWTEQMRSASASLAFEAAAAAKKRLERLGEFDCQAWSHAAPLEAFRFVLVQPGGGRRGARVFFADQGRIAEGKELEYPLKAGQLDRALRQMRRHLGRHREPGGGDLWRLALVAWYLFAGENRRGVILRWREDLSADELAEAIESSAKVLKLRKPAPRKGRDEEGGADTSG